MHRLRNVLLHYDEFGKSVERLRPKKPKPGDFEDLRRDYMMYLASEQLGIEVPQHQMERLVLVREAWKQYRGLTLNLALET
jgi:hypothetical protein